MEMVIDGVKGTFVPNMEETHNDWRLPTIKELLALVNYSKHSPASDLEDTKTGYYWSSTTYASNTNGAWLVNFYNGDTDYYGKLYHNFVRCVRDTEDGLQWSVSSEDKMTWGEAIKYASKLVEPVYAR